VLLLLNYIEHFRSPIFSDYCMRQSNAKTPGTLYTNTPPPSEQPKILRTQLLLWQKMVAIRAHTKNHWKQSRGAAQRNRRMNYGMCHVAVACAHIFLGLILSLMNPGLREMEDSSRKEKNHWWMGQNLPTCPPYRQRLLADPYREQKRVGADLAAR